MYTFMFIVLITLLFFSNIVNAKHATVWDRGCDDSNVIFPADATTEIHAMLARDRYINFTGWSWITSEYHRVFRDKYTTRLNESGGTEDISYGYLKEMVLHLSSKEEGIINARVFLTSGKDKLLFVHEINPSTISINQKVNWFYKFKLLEDGIQIKRILILKNGDQIIEPGYECRSYVEGYTKEDYSKIDGLLIAINCKTTNVKKILVKVHPK